MCELVWAFIGFIPFLTFVDNTHSSSPYTYSHFFSHLITIPIILFINRGKVGGNIYSRHIDKEQWDKENVSILPDMGIVSVSTQNFIARMNEACSLALTINSTTEKSTNSFRKALIDGIQCWRKGTNSLLNFYWLNARKTQ